MMTEPNRLPSNRLAGRTWRVTAALLAVGLAAAALFAKSARAERPAAPKLLPDRTAAYLRIHDTREFRAKAAETSMGKLLQDDKVQPFIADLYGSASEAFKQIEDQVGASLDELLSIPQGELCIAIVDPGVYNVESDPIFIVILEAGKNESKVAELMQRASKAVSGGSGGVSTEAFGDVELTVVTPSNGNQQLVYFLREGTLVAASNVEAAKDIVQTWDGVSSTRKLADNRKFSGLMRRSRGTKDERPQLAWYVDPILFIRSATRNNAGAQAALAFLPMFGVDGIKAAGGSMIMATEEFDAIQHMHVMLDSPRRGLLKLLEFKTGSGEPEPWATKDATAYMTLYFDLPAAFAEIERVVGRVRGPDFLRNNIEQRVTGRLGIDFQKEILDQWGGRITVVNWMEPPARINSQANLIGVKVKDPKAFQKMLQRVMAKFPEAAKSARFRQVGYYRLQPPRQRNNAPELVRLPTPCVAVLGDALVFSDSEAFLKEAITASTSGDSLGDQLDFKLILSRIRGHLGSDEPSMIAFSRPGDTLRMFYDLAMSDGTRERLAQSDNGFAKALLKAMKDHPLPPFPELAKYLAPSGGVMVQDEAGIHYMAFGLKRN